MKRSRVTLDEVVDWQTLCYATAQAAKGKRDRWQVRRFLVDLNDKLASLREQVLDGTFAFGQTTVFRIFDPKPRVIHAPAFRERVLHHALMCHLGPVLDRALIDDTYACRERKGTVAAIGRAQQHGRRFAWYAKLDVKKYFPSIDHLVLIELLQRKFKDWALLILLTQLIDAHHSEIGKGLPIGALTSQHFANFYLNGLDRYLLGNQNVRGLVRYMDDTVIWCESKQAEKTIVGQAEHLTRSKLKLELHAHPQINRSSQGLPLCGLRVYPGCVRLTQRRRRLYVAGRRRWERRYMLGEISSVELQRGFAAIHSIVSQADCLSWCREQLLRKPTIEI